MNYTKNIPSLAGTRILQVLLFIGAVVLAAPGPIFAGGAREASTTNAPGQGGTVGVIRVAAAANLASVGPALAEAFTKANPGYTVEWVFGASGALLTQIEQGAPLGVFMSADVDFAQQAVTKGLALGQPTIYARGVLILLSVRNHDLSKGLGVLNDPSVVQFALANTDTAPYGRAAKAALTAQGLWTTVASKAVYGQSITQAKQILTSAAGIGFINKSALAADDLANFQVEGRHWIAVDPKLHQPLDQAFVTLRGSGDPEARFARFLLGPTARTIFTQAGYGLP